VAQGKASSVCEVGHSVACPRAGRGLWAHSVFLPDMAPRATENIEVALPCASCGAEVEMSWPPPSSSKPSPGRRVARCKSCNACAYVLARGDDGVYRVHPYSTWPASASWRPAPKPRTVDLLYPGGAGAWAKYGPPPSIETVADGPHAGATARKPGPGGGGGALARRRPASAPRGGQQPPAAHGRGRGSPHAVPPEEFLEADRPPLPPRLQEELDVVALGDGAGAQQDLPLRPKGSHDGRPPGREGGGREDVKCRNCGDTGVDFRGQPCSCGAGIVQKDVKCRNCGDTGVDFRGQPCSCGAGVVQKAPPPATAPCYCPSCGNTYMEDSRFCRRCGAAREPRRDPFFMIPAGMPAEFYGRAGRRECEGAGAGLWLRSPGYLAHRRQMKCQAGTGVAAALDSWGAWRAWQRPPASELGRYAGAAEAPFLPASTEPPDELPSDYRFYPQAYGTCPHCGNVYMDDSNYCRKCGRARTGGPGAARRAGSAPPPGRAKERRVHLELPERADAPRLG